MKNVREMNLSELENIEPKDLASLSSEDTIYLADKIQMVCRMMRYYKDMRN